ncbi:hypothetical protein BC831DRAFT_444292 [Entophlyctis helioformis]|nr:hypothetical protein BC831DRAFT_444292 [Entophlyctis helioformis]
MLPCFANGMVIPTSSNRFLVLQPVSLVAFPDRYGPGGQAVDAAGSGSGMQWQWQWRGRIGKGGPRRWVDGAWICSGSASGAPPALSGSLAVSSSLSGFSGARSWCSWRLAGLLAVGAAVWA